MEEEEGVGGGEGGEGGREGKSREGDRRERRETMKTKLQCLCYNSWLTTCRSRETSSPQCHGRFEPPWGSEAGREEIMQ